MEPNLKYLNLDVPIPRRYIGGPVGYVRLHSPNNRTVTIFYDHHTTIGPDGDSLKSETLQTANVIIQSLQKRNSNLHLLIENMEETEEYGECMRSLMQKRPKIQTPQRVRFLQLITRENVNPDSRLKLESIEARSPVLLASRYWANSANPIVMGNETKLLIEKKLGDLTLKEIWDSALEELKQGNLHLESIPKQKKPNRRNYKETKPRKR
jgi:hypothetical protein